MIRGMGLAFGFAAALSLSAFGSAHAQDVTLRVHQFLPEQAAIPKNFLAPWTEKIEQESGGRIQFELYPSMQLGGKPPALYDQARDGVVDIVWTLAGYTPGRFPRSEAFEMPFIAGKAEATSQAAWDFYEKHLRDEFGDVKVLAVHTHSPGLIHAKGKGVEKLEDMQGLKVRGPTRMVNELLEELGAIPVGMPVPEVPEALSKGVIDATVIPWEVSAPLKVAELVNSHTDFSGERGLYTAFFVLAMNKDKYEALPDDLKKIIDANSGRETSRWMGRVMDEGDAPGLKMAQDRGNTIRKLDEAETARWKEKAAAVEAAWIADMKGKGVDGEALVRDVRALMEQYFGQQ